MLKRFKFLFSFLVCFIVSLILFSVEPVYAGSGDSTNSDKAGSGGVWEVPEGGRWLVNADTFARISIKKVKITETSKGVYKGTCGGYTLFSGADSTSFTMGTGVHLALSNSGTTVASWNIWLQDSGYGATDNASVFIDGNTSGVTVSIPNIVNSYWGTSFSYSSSDATYTMSSTDYDALSSAFASKTSDANYESWAKSVDSTFNTSRESDEIYIITVQKYWVQYYRLPSTKVTKRVAYNYQDSVDNSAVVQLSGTGLSDFGWKRFWFNHETKPLTYVDSAGVTQNAWGCWDQTTSLYETSAPFSRTTLKPNPLTRKYTSYALYCSAPIEKIIVQPTDTLASSMIVKYNGMAGTSINSFSKYFSLIKAEEVPTTTSTSAYSKISYWGSNKWNASSNVKTYLGTTNLSDTGYDKYIGYGYYCWSTGNAGASDMYTQWNAIDMSTLSLSWKATPASASNSSSEYVFGNTYEFAGFKTSLSGSSQVFKNALPVIQLMNAKTGAVSYSSLGISTLADPYNIMLGYVLRDYSTKGGFDRNTNLLNKGKQAGISATFLVPNSSPITSYMYGTKIYLDSDFIVEEVEGLGADTRTYTTASKGTFNLSNDAAYIYIVPNEYAVNPQDLEQELLDYDYRYNDYSIEAFLDDIFDGHYSRLNNKTKSKVTVGSTLYSDGSKVDGYTVYEFYIHFDSSPIPYEPAYTIPSFSLNSMQTYGMYNSSDSEDYYIRPIYSKLYGNTITYKDISSEGLLVSLDSGESLGDYLMQCSGGFPLVRANLVNGITVDTVVNSGKYLDYGLNLIRGALGDKRTLSAISYASLTSECSRNILNLDFGVKPITVYTTNVAKRNSSEVVYTSLERIKIIATIGNGSTSYKDINDYTQLLRPFEKYGIPYANIDHRFKFTANKYLTDTLATGKNPNTNGTILQDYSVTDSSNYKVATIKTSGKNLAFYPEVKMIGLWDTDKKVGGYTTKVYTTMGEVKRTVESSSLYLVKLGYTGTMAATGETVSDTMSKYGNIVSIPAGSDITVRASFGGMTMNFYGYSLDIIDKSKDSSMKIGASSTIAYNSIVKSGVDVYGAWNTTKISDTLFNNFKNWVGSYTSSGSYNVALSLYDSTGKKHFDVNTSVGSFSTSGCTEDGVYPIVISKGTIDTTSSGYKALITQIAADYGVTEAEATALFEDSGIYQSILSAIESCNDSFNKSGGTGSMNTNWVNDLGGNGNWYDETTQTFVVRRYTSTNNKVGNVIAQDKLDYSLASNSLNTTLTYTWKATLNITSSDLFGNNTPQAIFKDVVVQGANFRIPAKTSN